jgi:hypothetical protein
LYLCILVYFPPLCTTFLSAFNATSISMHVFSFVFLNIASGLLALTSLCVLLVAMLRLPYCYYYYYYYHHHHHLHHYYCVVPKSEAFTRRLLTKESQVQPRTNVGFAVDCERFFFMRSGFPSRAGQLLFSVTTFGAPGTGQLLFSVTTFRAPGAGQLLFFITTYGVPRAGQLLSLSPLMVFLEQASSYFCHHSWCS